MNEYVIIHSADELYHHGIKGQKWGVRRFQNPDGSYTARGKLRQKLSKNEKIAKAKKAGKVALGTFATAAAAGAGAYAAKNNKGSITKAFERNIKTKNGKISNAEDISNKTTSISRNISKIASNSDSTKRSIDYAKARKEAESMSDAELNKKVQRLRLEDQYASLKQSRVDTGKSKVSTYSDIALTALEITGAAVGIASAVVSIKKGGKG